jgi:hypothetical protein
LSGDGKTYDHDVVIDLSGAVAKRKKRLSKEKYGTSHIISKAEAKAIFEKGCARGRSRRGRFRRQIRPEQSHREVGRHLFCGRSPTREGASGSGLATENDGDANVTTHDLMEPICSGREKQ